MNWEEPYDRTVLEGNLGDFDQPLTLHKVDETRWERFWDRLVQEHHYLGYEGQFGGRIKYLATLGSRLVGAISFCSGAYKLGPRDRFIGWDEKTRLANLQHLLNNNRFLILPWIRIRNLASHILGTSLKLVREDWLRQYEVEPWLVETFVDRSMYEGTCYVASNWTYLGVTKGFGKIGQDFVYHGREKDIYVYVLNRRFDKFFRPSLDRLPNETEEILKMMDCVPKWHQGILSEIGVADLSPNDFKDLFVEHVRPYVRYFTRKEHQTNFMAILIGLMSDLERKSLEPIALSYLKVGNVRNLAFFMTDSGFDHEGMLGAYQKELGRFLSAPNGMITGDGCDFPKKGKNSVGVARQYCGALGKVDNCQASVMLGYTGPRGYGLIDYELYMSENWLGADYEAQRKRCKVPEGLEFKTKNQLLSEMIRKAVDSGDFKAKYVGVDSFFGRDHAFLDALPEGLIYFAGVPSDQNVFLGRPDMIVQEHDCGGRQPSPGPSFPPVKVSDIAQNSSIPWEEMVLGMGAKGPIIVNDKCVKVVEVRAGKPGKDVWLYMRQNEDGSIKYALCDESMDASPIDIRAPALMRWSIKQCFHECKDYLGMDHYELRSWIGWRRHMLLVFIAHSFLNKLRRLFSLKEDTPGPGPFPRRPVSLKEYR
ncbi:MAG: IS701 family transposase [Deltaproteobacteria bacterium]|jgi:SRSO17 transposase|nr:IS701 family transposase [Deltaproteobacteria bacterium]